MADPDIPPVPDVDELPPRVKRNAKAVENLRRVMEDSAAVEEIRHAGRGLLFFDAQSPAIKRRREAARYVFEEYVEMKLGRENLKSEEMWNSATFVEYTWQCLISMAKYAKGKIADKPKAGILYQQKQGMYWWAVRLIPDWTSIYPRWHQISNAAIAKATLMYDFSSVWREKNNLTDLELNLFWDYINKVQDGRENWKQHYVAWVLVWISAVRPGSFTVCPGYEKGALRADGTKRTVDETLYFRDLQFFRTEDSGIGVKITFRYSKGFRNPASQKNVEGTRVVTIFPLNGRRHHLDLALLLTSLAWSRGAFTAASVRELYESNLLFLPMNSEVAEQPVFVASNQASDLIPTRAMTEIQLSPKVQSICVAVGLLGRNTIYSFRRTAIVDTRRKHGTEVSQELAGHVMGGTSIYSYDNMFLADQDLANDRNDLPVIDRKAIRTMFAQVNTDRVTFDENEIAALGVGASDPDALKKTIYDTANRRAYDDPQNIAAELALKGKLQAARDLLLGLGVDAAFISNDQDIDDHLRANAKTTPACEVMRTDIASLRLQKRTTLRRLRISHRRTVRDELLKESKANLTVITRKTRGTTGDRGTVPQAELELQIDPNPAGAATTQQHIHAIESITLGGDGDDDDSDDKDYDPDADIFEEEESDDELRDAQQTQGKAPVKAKVAKNPRTMPEYEDVADNAEIKIQPRRDDDDEETTVDEWIAFVEAWQLMVSEQKSGLACVMCALDDTVPSDRKDVRYTASKLSSHLKGKFHDRESQILRAFHIDADEDGKAPCTICGKMLNAKGGRGVTPVAHFQKHHEDELNW
ncbi:hypothetical protein LTR95_014330 [Oleoguttula sp. CCFEE 5521]